MSDSLSTDKGLLGRLGVWVAIAGALLGATGDVLLLYHPDAHYFDPAYSFLAEKSDLQLLIGHYLGVFFIPLEALGLFYLRSLLRSGSQPRGVDTLFVLGLLLPFPGVVYHATLGFTAQAVQYDPAMIPFFDALSKPLAVALVVLYAMLSLLYFAKVWSGTTPLPKAAAWTNPLSFFILFAITLIALPPVGAVLLPAGFNLSVACFYLTLLLWKPKPVAL